jgi:hypothetical protein
MTNVIAESQACVSGIASVTTLAFITLTVIQEMQSQPRLCSIIQSQPYNSHNTRYEFDTVYTIVVHSKPGVSKLFHI